MFFFVKVVEVCLWFLFFWIQLELGLFSVPAEDQEVHQQPFSSLSKPLGALSDVFIAMTKNRAGPQFRLDDMLHCSVVSHQQTNDSAYPAVVPNGVGQRCDAVALPLA